MRRETCSVCSLPVFLAEKLVISRKTYHRTCFWCARCMNQLTPGNYYETEDGQYCCETCPDEDNVPNTSDKIDFQSSEISIINNDTLLTSDNSELSQINVIKQNLISISDEEKTLISTNEHINKSSSSTITISSSKKSKMRPSFIQNNLISNNFEPSVIDNINSSPDERQASQINNVKTDMNLDKCVEKLDQNVININIDDNNHEQTTAIKLSLDNNDNVEMCQDTKEKLGVYNNDDINFNNTYELTNDNDHSQFKLLRKINHSADNIDSSDFKNFVKSSTTSAHLEIQNNFESLGIVDLSEKTQTFINKNIDLNPALRNDEKDDSQDSQLRILSTPLIGPRTQKSDEYPIDMNPFANDGEENSEEDIDVENSKKLKAMNPFFSDDEGNIEDIQSSLITSKPAMKAVTPAKNQESIEPVKRKLKAPHINLNPFMSDDEDELVSKNETQNKYHSNDIPVPKQKTLKVSEIHLESNLDRSGFYASNTSLTSSKTTPGRSSRKKYLAPPPPTVTNEMLLPISPSSIGIKLIDSSAKSSNRTPKHRKSKLAPPPPILSNASTPTISLDNLSFSNLTIDSMSCDPWEDEKIGKNETNRTVRNLVFKSLEDSREYILMDKSTHGKWKRKKGPAPARPTPQRRMIKLMSLKDVKLELDEIELQQQGLEKQGVRLEKLIRDRCETGTHDDENLTMNVEELVLELFSLVNEKNELFRRQAELMLLKRQQRLEEEHADIEYQIRCLMYQSDATKTDFDKQREEKLIQRLVEIVERRSNIIECLEMDRRREMEEDKSINMHMEIYAAKSKGDTTEDTEGSDYSRKTRKIIKFSEFVKNKHLKKFHHKDVDKDVDESEVKLERKHKKKWF